MFTAAELKSALSEEIRVIRHLGTKVDAAKADWRPSPEQRSTIELMRYLAMCGSAPARAILDDDWTVVGGYQERLAELGPDGFDQAMADQEQELHAICDGLSEEDLAGRSVTLPWGATAPLSQALYLTSLRFLIAYRLQLFTHIKTSGRSELGTYEAWLGMDSPEQAPA